MIKIFVITVVTFFIMNSVFAFEIDFSRRKAFMKSHEVPVETIQPSVAPELTSIKKIENEFAPSQDVVILNTEKGFIPQSLSLRKGVKYKIHVVNVNEKEKNVSFIMSAFAEHHGTYYGQIKTFDVTPIKEGVYTYQCPETSLEGRVVVIPSRDRGLANEE